MYLCCFHVSEGSLFAHAQFGKVLKGKHKTLDNMQFRRSFDTLYSTYEPRLCTCEEKMCCNRRFYIKSLRHKER